MREPGSGNRQLHGRREALIGSTVAGKYRLKTLVGHGGMGAVYEAEQLGLGKRVAVKFIDAEFASDETVVARFAREARAMSAVESAHIVTVLDAGTEAGRPFLVMEFLQGEDLGRRLQRERRLPLAEALHVVAQVLKGLARAHAAGIVHRDLKPDNVFLVKSDTDPLFAKIVDFGISKVDRPRAGTVPFALTGRGTVVGTPFYMSPEQAQAAEVDMRADLYSVAAILFECLSGRPPHTGESYEQVILSICMRDAPDVRAVEPSVPAEVAAFLRRGLAREREQRFASAERMLAAVHELAPDEKHRVPLDPPSVETLLSAGVERPAAGASVATRIGVASLQPSPLGAIRGEAEGAGGVGTAAPEARAVGDGGRGEVLQGERLPRPEQARRARKAPRSRRSWSVLASAVATLLGGAAAFAIITAVGSSRRVPPLPVASSARAVDRALAPSAARLDEAPSEASAQVPSAMAPSSGASVSVAGSVGSLGRASAELPAATAAPSPAAAVKPRPAGPRKASSTAPLPGLPPASAAKPLDIQRDLP